MSLHGKIMNLQLPNGWDENTSPNDRTFYKIGFRDARHAAAELAIAQDALVGELVAALRYYTDAQRPGDTCGGGYYAMEDDGYTARAVLAKLEQTK